MVVVGLVQRGGSGWWLVVRVGAVRVRVEAVVVPLWAPAVGSVHHRGGALRLCDIWPSAFGLARARRLGEPGMHVSPIFPCFTSIVEGTLPLQALVGVSTAPYNKSLTSRTTNTSMIERTRATQTASEVLGLKVRS